MKQKDITATKLRRAVIKVLTIANKSLATTEILKEVRKFRAINKVTLYRILDLLEKKEILRKILTNGGISRYELIDPLANGKQNLHPHFICRLCKTITPLESHELGSLIQKKIGNKFGGPIELTIEGICQKCKKKEVK